MKKDTLLKIFDLYTITDYFLHTLLLSTTVEFGIIHLIRTQNFPKNQHFLPPDTHTYVCESGGKKCYFFEKFCVRTKWMTPFLTGLRNCYKEKYCKNSLSFK